MNIDLDDIRIPVIDAVIAVLDSGDQYTLEGIERSVSLALAPQNDWTRWVNAGRVISLAATMIQLAFDRRPITTDEQRILRDYLIDCFRDERPDRHDD